jgi:small acid-soluble spore protein F (minor alpha/beta-type SASP)
MSKSGIMSEGLKQEIARELGVYNTVKNEGWGSVSSKNCGNMVKKAIELANKNFE